MIPRFLVFMFIGMMPICKVISAIRDGEVLSWEALALAAFLTVLFWWLGIRAFRERNVRF